LVTEVGHIDRIDGGADRGSFPVRAKQHHLVVALYIARPRVLAASTISLQKRTVHRVAEKEDLVDLRRHLLDA